MKKLLTLFTLFFFISLVSASNSVNLGDDPNFKSVNIFYPTPTFSNITNVFTNLTINSNATNLSQLYDVDVTGVDDNDVLKWDDAIKKWIDSSLNSIITFGDDWFSWSGANELSFNEAKLNATIDMRANGLGDNSSWNQTYADTLYSPIGSSGGNATFNQTLTTDLYIAQENNLTEPAGNSYGGWTNGTFVIVGRT